MLKVLDTILTIARALEQCGDLFIHQEDDNNVTFILRDFIGFTKDGEEIYRKYTNQRLVDELVSFLHIGGIPLCDDGLTVDFLVNGVVVVLDRTSNDI